MGLAQSTIDWFSKRKRKDSTLSLCFFKWMTWKCELLRQHHWWKRLPCSWSFAVLGDFWTSTVLPQTTVSANLESFSLRIKWSNMEIFSLLCRVLLYSWHFISYLRFCACFHSYIFTLLRLWSHSQPSFVQIVWCVSYTCIPKRKVIETDAKLLIKRWNAD